MPAEINAPAGKQKVDRLMAAEGRYTAPMASTAVAIISGAAAIGGSVVTGLVAATGVKRTIAANSADLAKRLEHDRRLAREARDQERRERAYVSIVQYVNWLTYYLTYCVKTATHRMLTGAIPSDSDADQRAVTAPTAQENEATLALVTAVASPQVLKAFERLLDHKQTLESNLDTATAASGHGPSKPRAMDLTVVDALGQVDAAFKEANKAGATIKDLIRSELNLTE